MGLHSPFSYVMYEMTMIKTIIHLLDEFCTGCHTNDDYDDGCTGCPVGNLFYNCRDYLVDVYISDKTKNKYMLKYNDVLKNLKNKIKYLKPHPSFNANWVFQEEPSEDKIEYLRKTLKDLDFYHSQAWHPLLNKDALSKKKSAEVKPNGKEITKGNHK